MKNKGYKLSIFKNKNGLNKPTITEMFVDREVPGKRGIWPQVFYLVENPKRKTSKWCQYTTDWNFYDFGSNPVNCAKTRKALIEIITNESVREQRKNERIERLFDLLMYSRKDLEKEKSKNAGKNPAQVSSLLDNLSPPS